MWISFESDTNGNGSILRSTKMTLGAARQKNLENMSYKHNQLFYYAIIEMGGIDKFWKDLTGVTRERLEGKLFSFTQ